jgi:hypothetical protein
VTPALRLQVNEDTQAVMATQQDLRTPEVHTMKRKRHQTDTAFRITRANADRVSMWSNLYQLNNLACPGVSWNGTNLSLYVVHLVKIEVWPGKLPEG